MTMAIVWTLFVTASLVCGVVYGTLADVTAAAMEGASAAVELTLSMAGALCLWSGVMTVLEWGGLTAGLARLFRPLLRRILPCASRDADTLAAVSANVSANLLGLGNAATPLGIRAAQRMAVGCGGTAQRRAVPPGGAEHRVYPAAAHHRGRRPQRAGLHRAAGHSACGVAVVGAVGVGGTADGPAAAAGLEEVAWTSPLS